MCKGVSNRASLAVQPSTCSFAVTWPGSRVLGSPPSTHLLQPWSLPFQILCQALTCMGGCGGVQPRRPRTLGWRTTWSSLAGQWRTTTAASSPPSLTSWRASAPRGPSCGESPNTPLTHHAPQHNPGDSNRMVDHVWRPDNGACESAGCQGCRPSTCMQLLLLAERSRHAGAELCSWVISQC